VAVVEMDLYLDMVMQLEMTGEPGVKVKSKLEVLFRSRSPRQ